MTFPKLTDIRDYVAPMLRRPPVVQMAALCHRESKSGVEVLLVKSSAGRWILPKGWPIDGKSGVETALVEAWEEAGVRKGKPAGDTLGPFQSTKELDTGSKLRCETYVYPIDVHKMAAEYPEAGQRERRWVDVSTASEMVADEGLRDILAEFGDEHAA